MHAISVGEVNSCGALIEAIRREMPGVAVYVSVGTLAGRELAAQRLERHADGIFYAPLDYAFCVRGVIRAIRPALLVVMETEIWPNLWREVRRSGASLLVVNARISDKALPAYRRLGWFFREVLGEANTILAQTRENADRYRSLGCDGDIRYGGNLKYDFRPGEPSPAAAEWIAARRPDAVWIAASTMPPADASDPDEDAAVLDSFEELAARHPGLLLILVPRRPERFEPAAAEMTRRGIRFVRRSALTASPPLPLPGVMLLDTVGELAGLFRFADVVFMGGTLVNRGGHNILEPAYFNKPVVSGPNLQNFAEIAANFREAGALVEVQSAAELPWAVEKLIVDGGERKRLGELSGKLARASTGATQLAMAEVRRLHDLGVPRRPLRLLEAPLVLLSWVWRAGAAIDRWRKLQSSRTLPRPVVSVGGIGMGGAGKTPFAVYLAGVLRGAGLRPAFLTRGYGRESSEAVIAHTGDAVPVALTGDEAQILLRSGLGPVGIGASRYANGARMAAECGSTVFVLDDGFQHHRLRRDVDIVLIDCLDPFAGGRVFPAGRLREPLARLAQADAVVLTRSCPGRAYAGIRAALGEVPTFTARTRAATWVNADSGETLPLDALSGQTLRGFCGLGNPASFQQSLEELVPGTALELFPDHHRYRTAEVAMLATQVSALVTTQKDTLNLPEGWQSAARIPIYWLAIEMELDDPDRLRELVLTKISVRQRPER